MDTFLQHHQIASFNLPDILNGVRILVKTE